MAVDRCQSEILIAEDNGQFYHSLAVSLERIMNKISPLPSSFVPSAHTYAGTLSNTSACIAVNSTILVTVGHVLPMAYLLVLEIISRHKFEFIATGRKKFLPRPNILLMLHMLVVPLEAMLSFQCAVVILNIIARIGIFI